MPATDPFATFAPGLSSDYSSMYAITPHDTNEEAVAFRAIYVGAAGDITVVPLVGSAVLFKAVPVGTTLRVRGRRVNTTGTTASLLVGLY